MLTMRSAVTAQNEVTDSRLVLFSVNATIITAADTAPNKTLSGGNGVPGSSGSSGCSATCPSFFGVLCFVLHGCWSKFFSLLGTLAGATLGGAPPSLCCLVVLCQFAQK